MNRNIITAINAMAVILTLCQAISCQHKDLCYDHPHNGSLKVVFDWTKAAETVGQNMELFLFPTNGGQSLHYQFYDIYGGAIDVPSGTYEAICANAGTGANRFDDPSDSYDGFTVTTRSVGKADDVILEPDILYSDHIDNFEIIGGKGQTLVMYPVQKTPRYMVILNNIRNLNGARNCTATLSRLSCGYIEAKRAPTDDIHSQNFSLARAGETTLVGYVTIFGHGHAKCSEHNLTLHFTLQDGRELDCIVDITSRMRELAGQNSMDGKIIIDMDIDIPKPISNGSGFQPSVDGWEGEEVEVTI